MPLIKVQTSATCDHDVKESLLRELSALTAEAIGKPESYVLAMIEDDAVIAFGGEIGPCALVEVRSIGGLDASVNGALARGVTERLGARLGLDPSKIYVNFLDVARTDWAWKGKTFG